MVLGYMYIKFGIRKLMVNLIYWYILQKVFSTSRVTSHCSLIVVTNRWGSWIIRSSTYHVLLGIFRLYWHFHCGLTSAEPDRPLRRHRPTTAMPLKKIMTLKIKKCSSMPKTTCPRWNYQMKRMQFETRNKKQPIGIKSKQEAYERGVTPTEGS